MVTTVQIKIKLENGKEIILSHEDAKKLYEVLHEMYGEKEKITYIPYVPYYPPIFQPYEPWYASGDSVTITCSGSSLEYRQ